jgi:hypothetical protein
MGFKCPVCFKDFGRDKEEWSTHTKTAHKGVGDDIRKALDIAVTPETSHNSDYPTLKRQIVANVVQKE